MWDRSAARIADLFFAAQKPRNVPPTPRDQCFSHAIIDIRVGKQEPRAFCRLFQITGVRLGDISSWFHVF